MTYKIEQIEGIGPAYAARLTAVGVKTTDDLLTRCATPTGRRELELASGMTTTQLLTWANQADLMRVSGVGSEYGQLLESAGVDTVKELATRKAENLVAVMTRVNEEKNLTRALPSVKTVTQWIDQAKDMEPMLTH